MSGNLVAVHEKSKQYDWERTYVKTPIKYRSKYTIPKGKGKDPFRTLVRDYMAMESEKDDRVYGFLDGAVRMRLADRMEPRHVECTKLVMPALKNAEYQAVGGSGFLITALENQELRQGYAAQMIDEVRHSQIESVMFQYYARHYEDPAGFDIHQRMIGQHPGGLISVGLFQALNTGDPIDVVVALNIIGETAFTNVLFVALPQAAAANGDHVFATTLLSIQSDESRHMANGYGTLMTVLQDENNIPLINEALERYFWIYANDVNNLIGWHTEYGAKVRPNAYKDVFEEWVVDDFIGNFVDRLGEFGVTPPRCLAKASQNCNWQHHTVGIGLAALWPLHFWRSDAMGPEDYTWFENHYPGWHSVYGGLWDGHRALADPAGGHLLLQELPGVPPFCQVCQLPCILPRLDQNEFRIVQHRGKPFALCSEMCAWIFSKWPLAYSGRKSFWEKYHGWDLADVIVDLGLLRPDGRTLIGQPTLDPNQRMWTIDDIRRIGYEVKDPLHG
jgi:methane monooxygenase component A alpha chain/propane monooxygenase large subunit